MSQAVQITLIICGTIIFVQIFGFLIIKSLWNKSNEPKVKRDTERFGYCKSPTYPRPPRPGQGYQPKLKHHDNSELEKMRPPSTGSGIN